VRSLPVYLDRLAAVLGRAARMVGAMSADEEQVPQVDVPRLRLLGQRMEADFYLRRAYSVEDIQQIMRAADEVAGLRNLLRCAYEDVPGWVGDAAVTLRRVPRG
jgi:hypothetical protein